MNDKDKDALLLLDAYLEKKLQSATDREDMQQFILLLQRDILTQHSHHSLSHLVEQLQKSDELKLMLVHVDKKITISGSAALQCSFVEDLFGLLVFSFGPYFHWSFHLFCLDLCSDRALATVPAAGHKQAHAPTGNHRKASNANARRDRSQGQSLSTDSSSAS